MIRSYELLQEVWEVSPGLFSGFIRCICRIKNYTLYFVCSRMVVPYQGGMHSDGGKEFPRIACILVGEGVTSSKSIKQFLGNAVEFGGLDDVLPDEALEAIGFTAVDLGSTLASLWVDSAIEIHHFMVGNHKEVSNHPVQKVQLWLPMCALTWFDSRGPRRGHPHPAGRGGSRRPSSPGRW